MEIASSNSRAALVIAHPGHELCVYAWLETVRPLVFVLTDGSGRSGRSRLDSTTKILSQTGARRGSIYGRFTDLNIYKSILDGDFGLFEQLVTELAEALVEAEIEYVAGDAVEGYNPAHDTCRLVINAAVELAGRIRGRPIINRDFLLFARHTELLEAQRVGAILLTLDDDVLARKLKVARAYPELKLDVDAMLERKTLATLHRFSELSAEFTNIVTSTMGTDAYRTECLRLVTAPTTGNGSSGEIPFYERYGQLLVLEGTYERAISYRDHIAPLGEAVRRFANA
ncbi:MAG: hypothetical protein ACR2HX_01290 [Pyrinomonadaceae bacterium]